MNDERRQDDRRQESTPDVDVAVRDLALVEDVDLPAEAELEVTLVVDQVRGVHRHCPVDPPVLLLSSGLASEM